MRTRGFVDIFSDKLNLGSKWILLGCLRYGA